jgi:hypothetical protein
MSPATLLIVVSFPLYTRSCGFYISRCHESRCHESATSRIYTTALNSSQVVTRQAPSQLTRASSAASALASRLPDAEPLEECESSWCRSAKRPVSKQPLARVNSSQASCWSCWDLEAVVNGIEQRGG